MYHLYIALEFSDVNKRIMDLNPLKSVIYPSCKIYLQYYVAQALIPFGILYDIYVLAIQAGFTPYSIFGNHISILFPQKDGSESKSGKEAALPCA